MSFTDPVYSLAQLGFTNLEAEIYAFLVSESPATGYRIAQAIGKPAANTYKAIQTLERKGAVVVEDGVSRQCRAVPVDELLGRIGREFQTHRDLASKALKELGQSKPDDRTYQIRSLDGVLERTRQMLADAKAVVLASGPEFVIGELRQEVVAAVTRGVDVVIRSTSDEGLGQAEFVPADGSDGSDWAELQVVVDGQQHLVAFVSHDGGLIHALWSQNTLLSLIHHRGLSAELNLAQVATKIRDEAGQKRLLRSLGQHRLAEQTPGFKALSTDVAATAE